MFVVTAASIDFAKPARLDDKLAVSVRLESLGKVRCVFAQEIRRDDEVLVRATITVACVAGDNFKPAEIPGRPEKEDGGGTLIVTHDLSVISMILNASIVGEGRHGSAGWRRRCCRGPTSS